MATKRFITPFAESGIKAPVSDVPAGTDVNYETGYTPEYALDPVSDPSARFVEITDENQILNDITGNVKLWQDDNYPEFITTAKNGGVAHSYNKNVVVRYGGDLYISTEDGNDTLPTSAKWIPYLPSEIAKYLELKIFQSPTDGLTEINTRTLLGGEVYEVRRVSDNSLTTIYSDKEGDIEIAQNGTSNVSNSGGTVEFYIADGDYYVEVNAVHSNFYVKGKGSYVTPEMFGALPSSTPEERSSALQACLSSGVEVLVTAGQYATMNFDAQDISVTFDEGSVFKLPDNTTSALSTEPVPTVTISGDNIKLHGYLRVDGNLQNNLSDSINTSTLIGALHVTGANAEFDSIEVSNASWVAYSEGDENNDAVNCKVKSLSVINPRHYSTSIWSKSLGGIDYIRVIAGVDSLDARIRTGSQSSSLKSAENFYINTIQSNDSVVFESNTSALSFSSIDAEAAKAEDCKNIVGSTLNIKGTQGAAFAWASLSTEGVKIASINIEDYQGTAGKAVALDDVNGDVYGSITVSGTQGSNADLEIRAADGLDVGVINLKNHAGSGTGFRFDYDAAYSNQKNITIGRINSSGHTGLDVEVQSPQLRDITIGSINQDATTNLEYLKRKNKYESGTKQVSLTPSSGSITMNSGQDTLSYVRDGDQVTCTGRLGVSAVSSPTGGLTVSDLPFPVANADELGGFGVCSVRITNLASNYSGVISGQFSESSVSVDIVIDDGTNAPPSPAPIVGVGTVVLLSISYLTYD